MLDKVHYIIPYRESTPERRVALRFVLDWLTTHLPEVAILIVEQDEVSKLNLSLPRNCQKIFLYNPGLFNKGWALNHAARISPKSILAFGDADGFLERADYLKCFTACLEFEASTAHLNRAINVTVKDSTALEFVTKETRNLYVFAAMFFVVQKDALLRIGGWDERFAGWGGEDEALSHLLVNRLSNKIFKQNIYHIDHPRLEQDGRRQPRYSYNETLCLAICTYQGPALDRYVKKLKAKNLGNPEKYRTPAPVAPAPPKFIIAVTTYNRLPYLKDFVDTFVETHHREAHWEMIIADDGSEDGTLEYVESLQLKDIPITLIKNNRTDITHQTNTIIRELSQRDFDLCFKCDDDILFLKPGWDQLYWEAMERTGYSHFAYYNLKWWPTLDLEAPIKKGELICYATSVHQGAFFTLTPEIIREVGYFDRFNFGFRGYEHNDYTVRCCRAGFNCLQTPFDVKNSNNYLDLQTKDGYAPAIPDELVKQLNTEQAREWKRSFQQKNRIYIPFSADENTLAALDELPVKQVALRSKEKRRLVYQLADDKYYPERGWWGRIGTGMKRCYNFFVRRNILWFPRLIKRLGLFFIKAGEDLRNIDQ